MAEYHRLLKRQLKRAGFDIEKENFSENYLKLLQSISNAYTESESGYYTTMRSNEIASEEMSELRERLHREQEMIRSVMSDGLCIIDKNWKIISLNETGAKLLSMHANEVLNKTYSEIFKLYCDVSTEDKNLTQEVISHIVGKGTVYHCEKAFLETQNSILKPIAFSINPLVDKNNGFNGIILLFRSTQERVDTENALQNAIKVAEKSNQAKTIFLANMSHEIRTPLNGIMGMLQLLQHTPLQEKQTHYVKKGFECAQSLLKILGDILDFAKIEAGRVSFETLEFSLKHELNLLIAVYTLQCDQKNITLKMHYDENIPANIKGDVVKIKQIFNNLLSNAIKFTPENGSISVKVILQESENGYVIISCSITDTGIGISEDAQEKIFQMFSQADDSTTRQYGGTGLGLAITKQLVEMMGGEIEVQSTLHQGSAFHFTLKLNTYDLNGNHAPPETSIDDFQGFSANVLVVEDNEINRAVACDMLKMLGCTPTMVESGELAVNMVQEKVFDLILMDCHMPGMDGFEATHRIRELEQQGQKTNIIIALTANALKGTKQRCLDAGMNDYMTKPVSMNQLAQKLQKHLPQTLLSHSWKTN